MEKLHNYNEEEMEESIRRAFMKVAPETLKLKIELGKLQNDYLELSKKYIEVQNENFELAEQNSKMIEDIKELNTVAEESYEYFVENLEIVDCLKEHYPDVYNMIKIIIEL